MSNHLSIGSKKTNIYNVVFSLNFDEPNIKSLASFVKKNNYRSVFILVDNNIAKYYLSGLLGVLQKESIHCDFYYLISNETNKSLESCQPVYKKMLALNLDRKTLFINFGGGITLDLGGFVASTYKRGLDFINIPTSLLAMVDASIGGKVGVNLAKNKNAIGLFANPKLVMINIGFLKTLPKREFFNGWAEIIKHGLIYDRDFFELVSTNNPYSFSDRKLLQIIKKSCEIKYSYVKDDEHDFGKRQILNFGHTVGHALESCFLSSSNELKHGEAILWGILIESFISNFMDVLSDKEYSFIKEKLENFGLTKIDFNSLDTKKLKKFLFNDKKNQKGKIIFNLIRKISDIEYGQVLDLKILNKTMKSFKENYANYSKNKN